MSDDQRVQVAEASDDAEAEVIREVLQLAGIDVYYAGENEHSSPDPIADLGRRGIFVDSADADAARQALTDARS